MLSTRPGPLHIVPVVCALLCACTSALAGDIVGTVTDDLGTPIGSARINLWRRGEGGPRPPMPPPGQDGEYRRRWGPLRAATDAEGRFAFSDLEPGPYNLDASAGGHRTHRQEIRLEPDAPLELNVALLRGCRITGRIALASREPLSDSRGILQFVGEATVSSTSVRTGPDGAYDTVVAGEPGLHRAVLDVSGYAIVERPGIELTVGGQVENVDFVLDSPAGSIAGIVYEPDGKTPRSDAIAWCSPISRPHWLPPIETVPLPAVGLSPPRPPPHMAFREFSYVSSRRVAAFTIPPSIGPPHLPDEAQVTTDPDGSFLLTDLTAGTYRVYAYAPGCMSTTAPEDLVVARGQNVTGASIVLRPGASITGTVYGTDGRPLPNSSMSCRLTSAVIGTAGIGLTTDAGSRYSVTALAPGRYEMELRASNGARALRELELAEGEAATAVDVYLTEGIALNAVVSGPHGRPVAGARVRLSKQVHPRSFESRWAETGPEGRVRFEHLRDGRYWVIIDSAEGAPQISGPITVAGRAVPELRITLSKGAIINGWVLDDEGNPVAGASVRAYASTKRSEGPRLSPAPETFFTTDARGEFCVEHALPGRWWFMAEAPGHASGRATVDVHDDGPYELEIVMPRT